MPKLTKRIVDAAAADGRDGFLFDDGLKGFALRVFASGRKSFLVQYRDENGRTRRVTIGPYGPLTVEMARTQALKLLADIHQGGNPAEKRAVRQRAYTVAELADLYLREGPPEKPTKKLSSWTADESNIKRHILPLLGKKLICALSKQDIASFQADVQLGKTARDEKTCSRGVARVRGGKGTAVRSLAVLGAMLNFAVDRGLLATNPARGVKPLKLRKRERFLSLEEISRVGEALRAAEGSGANPYHIAAIRLLMLTGCRKSEITGLKWAWVDFYHRCLRLPDSKTGAKIVPLAAPALSLLRQLRSVSNESEFVLPSFRASGPVVGVQKQWAKIRVVAKVPDLRLHDTRHTFASVAVADGATLFAIGKLLGHRQAKTTEIYAHLGEAPIRSVAEQTALKIASALDAPVSPALLGHSALVGA